jgi:hypothetical protein
MANNRPIFDREKLRFETCVDFAISVSKLSTGRQANMPRLMASYVFTRTCVSADSLRYLLRREVGESKDVTLDHYSISVLARNIVEASLMFHYLMEDGVSDDEWSLRGKVLHLHDVVLKLRLFKSIDAAKQYEKFRQATTELRDEIKKCPAFKELAAGRQEKLLAGHELYLRGLRSTLKLVDIDSGYFDGMYAYLSTQVHISPSSFFETDKRISFPSPANYQYYSAAYALAHTRMLLLRASIRLVESDAALCAKIEADSLQSMKGLADIPFGE